MSRHTETGASEGDSDTAAFVHSIRVNWGDCDPARIVYTARIPSFALDAIDAWWDHQIGFDWYRLNLDRNIGTPFVHLDIDFRLPVTPRSPLDCDVRLVRIGEKSVSFKVSGAQAGQLCFAGTFVTAFVAADDFRTIAIPIDIRQKIGPLLRTG
jgi:4-hydroxybenzoyl-CoA thioesterase